MTAAFQTGQFHTGSSDTPATEPSLFVAAADAPQSALDAEEVVTQQLAAAAGESAIEGTEKGEEAKEAEEAKRSADLKDGELDIKPTKSEKKAEKAETKPSVKK